MKMTGLQAAEIALIPGRIEMHMDVAERAHIPSMQLFRDVQEERNMLYKGIALTTLGVLAVALTSLVTPICVGVIGLGYTGYHAIKLQSAASALRLFANNGHNIE